MKRLDKKYNTVSSEMELVFLALIDISENATVVLPCTMAQTKLEPYIL